MNGIIIYLIAIKQGSSNKDDELYSLFNHIFMYFYIQYAYAIINVCNYEVFKYLILTF
jgi:hypothetical protein